MNRAQKNSDNFSSLYHQLKEESASITEAGWPHKQLIACDQHGVYRWFLPPKWGGNNFPEAKITQGYIDLSSACLTTAFVLTQRQGAVKRILSSKNEYLKQKYLPKLASSEMFATVGISHLTTSRRHLKQQVLLAENTKGGYILNGMSPWVTGAVKADLIVMGAELNDGRQILFTLKPSTPGVHCNEPAKLVSLSESLTGAVELSDVFVPDTDILAGPVVDVLQQGAGGNTGGLQTSTLALGLSDAAISYLEDEAVIRTEISPPTQKLRQQWQSLHDQLLALTQAANSEKSSLLRSQVNSLTLRATHSAIAVAKGAGFIQGHPTGLWCQQALFFLVWSCPKNVLHTNICELAALPTDF
ncbi:MAG: acyl-CoA/acyl-ACP dehydrogenase [Pirellulaceae bacterium]|nr:acyl-CoA/acyl-ACP dehydrogenase [Pirellulaceae bacterium]